MRRSAVVYPELAPITLGELDALTPDLDGATIDDLASRLAGLSGALLELECIKLAAAMLDDMHAFGYEVGRLEHLVVLALLRAAIVRTGEIAVGHA